MTYGGRNNYRKYIILSALGAVAAVGILFTVSFYAEPEGEFVIDVEQDEESPRIHDPVIRDPLAVPPEPANEAFRLPDPFNHEEESVASAATISTTTLAETNGQIIIEGKGFNPNEQVTITINQNVVESEIPIITNDVGRFSTEITSPEIEGEHTITAIDKSGVVASTTLSS